MMDRLRTAPLSLKVALFSAAMTVLVVGVTFVALRQRVTANVRGVFAAELAASQEGARRLQEQNLRLLLQTSTVVSSSPTLRAALQTFRVEANAGLAPRTDLVATVRREAERIFADLDRDLLVVADERGRVIASLGAGAPPAGEDLSRLPAVRHALNTDSARADSSFGLLLQGGARHQVGCVAIMFEGFPAGALLIGDRLTDLMAALGSAQAGTRALVTAGDEIVTSTLEAMPAGSRFAAAVPEGRASQTWQLRLDNDELVAASLPLGASDDGRPAALHLVRSLSASLAPMRRSLGRDFLIAGLIAVLLVGGGTAVLARTTLGPLSQFVSFLRAGAGTGTLSRYEGERASAEIATLTAAYNNLLDSLGKGRGELERTSVQLASVNEALRESEEALRQSQKLEALGTLAGGVAHDFNNLLSVIIGYAHLADQELPAHSPQRADVAQIAEAAERATGLVRQLLAFSRKQVLQPQIVDLNTIVNGMTSMLRRLIGEDVELATKLEPRLLRTTADPGQLEQVLMNLVVNARDAMPDGGRVTIETANVTLDERFENRPEAIAAGPAVMLAVADNGVGMDAATRARIFEPFFTTKPAGKGTGLGLSTVYGIVRQSGGSITVYSEPGEGCTFRCYFPTATATAQAAATAAPAAPFAAGTETVLVAEDEPQLRALVRRTLASRGYTVLEACHGSEALEVAEAHRGPIHLLVSDVVMPHLSGKELAERLRARRPEMQVIYVSGYSDEAIARHGVLSPGTVFLQKPVQPDLLARAVRDLLDLAAVNGT